MHNEHRYSGPPTVLASYANEFVVECPKCKKEAVITVETPKDYSSGKLICKSCMHSEEASAMIRYRFALKRNCENCRKAFESVVQDQREAALEIKVACPHCGSSQVYTPKWEAYRKGYDDSGRISDPVFNLPLWFQAAVRDDVFWALNREHLREIKEYVTSKLRERRTTLHTTMVEKLPQFIKDAKNRNRLIKVIDRLERK